MFAGIRKRLARKQLEKDCDDDDKDDLHDFGPPPNYIQISQGKIQLVHQTRSLENEPTTLVQDRHDKALLEKRIFELEGALLRLQEQFSNSQCGSPTFEKELREQLENMNRVMKSKERKQLQTCRDHKVLQTRFARQESLLHAMQQENRALVTRIRQYEHCLDDVMRKVVDAIVAEDNLREEVVMLKSRVRDLEAQNAALSASPVKGRDEGYCTMSSGQPQPSNGHLEDLPEEPEQWLLPAEPCSTEMEDWSMSQEELAVITFDEEREQQQKQLQQQQQQQRNEQRRHEWLWNSNDFINSTTVETDSVADSIAQLLQQKIVYSEDEEVACTDFTNDFYKLVNIRSNSSRSLYSYLEGETDDEDDDDDIDEDDDEDDDSSLSTSQVRPHSPKLQRVSPTPSEAGRAQLTSCSSSESDELSRCTTHVENDYEVIDECRLTNSQHSDVEIEDVQLDTCDAGAAGVSAKCNVEPLNEQKCIEQIIKTELRRPPHVLVKSKSVLEEDEPSCILRHNQRREIESSVVRSGSVNCAIAAKLARDTTTTTTTNIGKLHLQERLLQRPANSWRRSNGWKRVTSPVQNGMATNAAHVSTKKETKTELPKAMPATSKTPPTRIPTSKNAQQQQQQAGVPRLQQQQQQQYQRKSKIPPPVPVRRSYAS